MTVEKEKMLMKNELCWTKTILTVYRYLERICGAIDKIVMQSALGSSNIVGQNYFYNNTLTVSQKIIDLSERKVTLINLKILIEDTLAEINSQDAQLLIVKYLDGKDNSQILETLDMSKRSFFRKLPLAEMSFKRKLTSKGYNDIKLKNMLGKEAWINNVYNTIAEKDEGFVMSNSYLSKAVSM